MSEAVGNAYVNVVPKVDGNPQAIGSEIGSGLSSGMKGTFGAGAVALGNMLSNAITGVASSIGEQFSKTFWNYADFEQLSGGVEKIFDQANTTQILKDAQGAFKDLNMSANEYLSSINQVGATFAQTMGDQKGYDTARKGMLAISDYASGTGRDLNELNDKFSLITRSTSSYQSIADQFSGILPATSADFLEQAQAAGFLSDEYTKLTEVPVAEYQEAVTNMLEKGVEDMGLAGNTAKESATTLSGSLAMLQGSWENLLTAIGDGGQQMDLTAVTQGFVDAIGAVALNVVPALARIGETIVIELPGILAESVTTALGNVGATLQPIFGTTASTAAQGFIDGLLQGFAPMSISLQGIFDDVQIIAVNAFQPLAQLLAPILSGIASVVVNAMTVVLDAVSGVTDFLSQNVAPIIQQVADLISPIVSTISSDVSSAMGDIFGDVGDAFEGILSLAEDVWPDISDTILEVVGAVSSAISVAWPVIKQVASTVFGAVKTVVQQVWPVVASTIKNAVQTAKDVVSTAIGAIKRVFDTLRDIIGKVKSTFDSIKKAITQPIEQAKSTVSGILDKIKGFFPLNIGKIFSNLKLPHISVSGGSPPFGIGGKGSLPSFSVQWYARGGILDEARLIGAGEAGTEFIWPGYDPYMSRYAKAIAQYMPSGSGVTVNFSYTGSGDASEAVSLLTRDLRQLKAAGVL